MSADRTGRSEMGKWFDYYEKILISYLVILTGNSYPELAENISKYVWSPVFANH